MKNQILIQNNDPSTSPNVTSCVENGSVVDTLDVTHNLDVSLDCACSAEKVYSINIPFRFTMSYISDVYKCRSVVLLGIFFR